MPKLVYLWIPDQVGMTVNLHNSGIAPSHKARKEYTIPLYIFTSRLPKNHHPPSYVTSFLRWRPPPKRGKGVGWAFSPTSIFVGVETPTYKLLKEVNRLTSIPPDLYTSITTPHPAFGHLLPQGAKGTSLAAYPLNPTITFTDKSILDIIKLIFKKTKIFLR